MITRADAEDASDAANRRLVDSLVAHGMRAEIKTGNLLTGQKYVALDIYSGLASEHVNWNEQPAVFPTTSGALDEIQDSVGSIAKKLDKVPFDQISARLMSTMASLDQTLKSSDKLLRQVNDSIAPQVDATLKEAQEAMQNAKNALAPDAPLQTDLSATLLQLSRAAKSVSALVEYLERHPEALIRGKPGDRALRMMFLRAGAAFALLMASCATQPDHFYALTPLPDAARAPAGTLSTHVILNVTIPPVVDRRELVLNDSNGRVLILEHERWAAPFAEQVSDALARDIEQRRSDVVVADRGFDRAGTPPVRIRVDVVRMSARRNGRATLEAHWRIVDPAAKIGRDRRAMHSRRRSRDRNIRPLRRPSARVWRRSPTGWLRNCRRCPPARRRASRAAPAHGVRSRAPSSPARAYPPPG